MLTRTMRDRWIHITFITTTNYEKPSILQFQALTSRINLIHLLIFMNLMNFDNNFYFYKKKTKNKRVSGYIRCLGKLL